MFPDHCCMSRSMPFVNLVIDILRRLSLKTNCQRTQRSSGSLSNNVSFSAKRWTRQKLKLSRSWSSWARQKMTTPLMQSTWERYSCCTWSATCSRMLCPTTLLHYYPSTFLLRVVVTKQGDVMCLVTCRCSDVMADTPEHCSGARQRRIVTSIRHQLIRSSGPRKKFHSGNSRSWSNALAH